MNFIQTDHPETHDFVAMARERAMARKITVTQAMKELARMDPEGHKRWVEAQGPLPILDHNEFPD